MYDKAFQQHAKQALAANPFEPMVMLRTEKPYAAYDTAMQTRLAVEKFSRTRMIPLL